MDGQAERPSEWREGVKSLDTMSDERKTLEQRSQMTDLERLRHSASHVLATAILNFPCTCDGDLENLAGSTVRRRAAGGKRFLLRCRSPTPHFARRF